MNKKIDLSLTLFPFFSIVLLCIFFFLQPEASNAALSAVRGFLGNELGLFYLLVGLGIFLLSLYLAFSRYGEIVLGEPGEKPRYSFFRWGAMMFTAGLAADILFYSLCEWISYAEEPYVLSMGPIQDWAVTYSLFHWGLIPWGFYLLLAAAFGFMLHVRKGSRQKYSEACRPLLGRYTDGFAGRVIDLLAVFALLAGTATTFSVATPLLAEAVRKLFGLPLDTRTVTILILLLTCAFYTVAVLRGMAGISLLASLCSWLFYGLLAYVLLFGGECRFILENGFAAIGRLLQGFFPMATYTDPLRENGFPQNWTIFFWAYWMVWCVAAPFFIGSISRGRRIRDVILGGYAFGVGSTCLSFLVLGNYSLGLQLSGRLDVLGFYHKAGDLYRTIVAVVETLPLAPLVLLVLILTMIAFYATSFDSIALVAAQYSYRELREGEEPGSAVKALWSVLLILLPIALVFSESSMANLQSVSIIAAFPIGFVILLIAFSFLKDLKKYQEEELPLPERRASGGRLSERGDLQERTRAGEGCLDPMSDEGVEVLLGNWERSYGEG